MKGNGWNWHVAARAAFVPTRGFSSSLECQCGVTFDGSIEANSVPLAQIEFV